MLIRLSILVHIIIIIIYKKKIANIIQPMKKFLILFFVLALASTGLANFRKFHKYQNNGRGSAIVNGIRIYFSATSSQPAFCSQTCAEKIKQNAPNNHYGVICGSTCCWASNGSTPGCDGRNCYSGWGESKYNCRRYDS
jgi:hypothetical protein